MQTQRELDELEAREADVAARLFLRTDEGPPTCPPPTPEEAAAEDKKYGLLPVTFDFESQREFIRQSMEACRKEGPMNIMYQLKGNAVAISDGFSEPMILNLESVKFAVKNIKINRLTYTTTAAYKRHLSTYEGALASLKVNLG